MRCWEVKLNDCDSAYALAETPGKATMAAIHELEGWGGEFDVDSWKGIRRKRIPALDGEVITERQMVEGGYMWTGCRGCGGKAGPPHGAVFDTNDAVFCEQDCMDAWHERHPDQTPHTEGPYRVWFVSTEY